MRSPTLLTGLTGTVAVLVLLYVGLTAMNLQPHITFGDPDRRLASADSAPAKPATAPTIAAETPGNPPPPTPGPPLTAAATAPAGASPSPSAVVQAEHADSAAAPAKPTTANAKGPPAALPAVVSPPPSAAGNAATPPLATAVPAATPSAPPVVAAIAPKPDATSVADALPPIAPSPEPAEAPASPIVNTPAAASPQPNPARPIADPRSVVASAGPPESAASEAAISERMAPTPPLALPTPPIPATPLAPPVPDVAGIPTPTARPRSIGAEQAETSTGEAALPSDDKAGQADRTTPKDLVGNAAPPTESAALTPQPEKPDATAIQQPNGVLKPVDLSRPFAERAGILTIGGRSLQLAGIVPTDPERICTGPNGKEWPCGTLARTALRSFLLGRMITCDVADPAWKGEITAECRFAKLSLGDWLARTGWAEVASGSPFAAAADEARQAGRGVYGNDPRKKHQSTLAPEPPKEDPLNPI